MRRCCNVFINEGLESNLSHSASLQRICRLECCTLWLEELVTRKALFNKTKLILKPLICPEYFHLGSVVAYELMALSSWSDSNNGANKTTRK